jgi:hypothetical protein
MRYLPVKLDDIESGLTFTTVVVFHSIIGRARIEFGTAGEFTVGDYPLYQRLAPRAPRKNGSRMGEDERLDHHSDISGKNLLIPQGLCSSNQVIVRDSARTCRRMSLMLARAVL